ncbi:MAG: hypothetical protein H7Z16_15930 [Pyrinomonadaceae bacterium]|nr:hypothetical protein [Pyrinomonadaceae bacterium]
MRTFAKKPKATQQTTSPKSAIPGRAHFGQSREVSSLQRLIGNQAVQRLSEANTRDVKEDSTTKITGFGHDFSQIPVHATTPMPVQPRVTTGVPGDHYDNAGDRRAEPAQDDHRPTDLDRAAQAPDDLARDTFGFGTLRIIPIPASAAGARSSPTMPTADGGEQDIFVPPPTGGGNTAPANPSQVVPTPETDSCEQPRSMNKIVSGSFLGGLTMDDYFPDLSGQGFWAHAGTGGPFDTGTQAGGNAQLFGVIPSPCLPSQFHLEQTANPVRFRIGGVAHPLEGTTFDDIARSGRDFSRAPSRQEFLGGGAAPLGFIISMADPPSVNHGPSRPDVERDTNFVSSLVGPSGRQSVSWSQSVHVAGGVVTVNTLT